MFLDKKRLSMYDFLKKCGQPLFVKEIRVDEQPVEYTPRGSIISIPVPEKVRKNDVLYLFAGRNFVEI